MRRTDRGANSKATSGNPDVIKVQVAHPRDKVEIEVEDADADNLPRMDRGARSGATSGATSGANSKATSGNPDMVKVQVAHPQDKVEIKVEDAEAENLRRTDRGANSGANSDAHS